MSFLSSVEGFLGKILKFVVSGQAEKDAAVALSTIQEFEQAIGVNIGSEALAKAAAWNTALVAIGASAVKAVLSGTAAVEAKGANIALDAVAWEQAKAVAADIKSLLGGNLPASLSPAAPAPDAPAPAA